MKKIGIICEYNPFHNGHVYHIEKIKEMYPDSILILVLGSYFLERGEVSLISKWNKTEIALKYGINLVLELPVLYGTNSADYFALQAVKTLNEAGVDTIVFGSESNDLELLKKCATMQTVDEFDKTVKEYLAKGSNYPSSLSSSLKVRLSSNDILGVAYIKAVDKINPSIEVVTIKRTSDYNDTESDDKIVSASNIREKLKEGQDIRRHIPNYDATMINKIDEDKLFELVRFKVITDKHLERYLGVDEGLENKLKKEIVYASSFEDLLDRLKSKRYTKNRQRRMLIHILLGIEKTDMEEVQEEYRILGFDDVGRSYLKELNNPRLVYKMYNRIFEIEQAAALVYYDLTGDESAQLEPLNRPIKA